MGDCGTHHYDNIDRVKMELILKSLRDNSATVSGDNPWEVDTHKSGVKLMGTFSEPASTLDITVVDTDWWVPCSMVWNKIDELMRHVHSLPIEHIAV